MSIDRPIIIIAVLYIAWVHAQYFPPKWLFVK